MGPAEKWPRRYFVAGWIVLGIGQLAHGALFFASELDAEAVALRFGGMALIVFGMLPRSPANAANAVVFPVIGPAFLSAAGAWLSWRRPILSKPLSFAFGAMAAAELLVAGSSGRDTGWVLGHAMQLAASVLIFLWVSRVLATSIRTRFVGIFLAILLIALLVVSSAMTQIFTSNVTEEALRDAAQTAESQQALVQARVDDAISDAGQVAGTNAARTLVANRDPQLADQVAQFQSPGGLFDAFDFMAFLDNGGQVLAVSAAGQSGTPNLDNSEAIALAGTDVVQSALAGNAAGSLDTLGPRRIVLVGAHPVFNPAGFDPPGAPQGIAGALVLGSVVDVDYLNSLKRDGEQEVLLITATSVLASTTSDTAGVLEQREAITRTVFDRQEIFTRRGDIGATEYFSSYIPLKRADGRAVGALVIAQRSDVLELTQRDVGRTLFLLALLSTVLAIALSFFSGTRITDPIRQLTAAAESLSRGELGSEVKLESRDEVGILGRTFNSMSGSMLGLTNELKQAAEEEFRLRSRLEAILQSMSDGVVAADADARIVALNKEAERLLGVSSSKAVGKGLADTLLVFDRTGNRIQTKVLHEGGGSRFSGWASRPDGTPVAVTSSPLGEEGDLSGTVILLRDLTQELEVDRMKTEFLSNISHELRTPLTPIRGFVEILKKKEFPRKQTVEYLTAISTSAQSMERIVNMLVEFSQMEAGRLVPRKAPTDLGEVVTKLIESRQARHPDVKFEKVGFRGLPKTDLDQRLIALAIDELIDNAVKFGSGSKVTISAMTGGSGKNGRSGVRLNVVDRGIGMTADQIVAAQKDFEQADASATRAYGGLGLGLAYVKRIVSAHGGRLSIESSPGKGSTFSILFPASAVVHDTKSTRDRSNGAAKRAKAKPAPRKR